MKIIYSIIAVLCFFFVSYAQAEITVRKYLDTTSSGWAYKESDYAYEAEQNGCKIKWNVILYKDGKGHLEVSRSNCRISFESQMDIHRAILNRIDAEWAIKTFSYLYWGPYCLDSNRDWCRKIAQQSVHSEVFIDYWKHYPDSKETNINVIFSDLANSTRSYKPLNILMHHYGVQLQLEGVEKITAPRYKFSDFYGELETGQLQNPRVLENGESTFFQINVLNSGGE